MQTRNPPPSESSTWERKLILEGKDGCNAASVKQTDLLHQLPILPTPRGSAPPPTRRRGPGVPRAPCSSPRCRSVVLAPLGDTWGCSLQPEGGGNRGRHHPAAPDGERVGSSCALILGKWWGYSLLRGKQTATGVLIYKACPLKLTGLCKDLLHPALRRAIRAERDFATYVGRKRGVRAAGEEPSVSR